MPPNPRSDLRRQLIQAFTDQPEIYALYLFGKEVWGSADRFSDIDLIVCSNDLSRTERSLRHVLNCISPVLGSLLLHSDERQLSQMFMLRDYSPYQKLDLSIVEHISQQSASGPFLAVYEQPEGEVSSRTRFRAIARRKDTRLMLHDVLFAVPRFTKCLYRRDYDMYRRWIGLVRLLWVQLYEAHFGWEAETTRRELAPQEARDLYRVLDAEEQERLEGICPLSGQPNLAPSYRHGVRWYADLSAQKAQSLGVELNELLIEHVLRFLDEETQSFG